MSGQVVVPVLLEGQIGLTGPGDLHVVFQQLDADIWRVEAADVADEDVGFPELSWVAAVDLDLW